MAAQPTAPLRISTPKGTIIEVTDAQVHVNLLGGVSEAVAAMNAVGVQAVVFDEFAGWDDRGRRMPNTRSRGGTVRHEYPMATEAWLRHPDRFAAIAWVDYDDPAVEARVEEVHDRPFFAAIRVPVRPERGDDVALEAGAYDRLFAAAQHHAIPITIALPRVPVPERAAKLRPHVARFEGLQFILDHCGVFPLSADDEAAGLRTPETLLHVLELAKLPNVAVKWSWNTFLSADGFPYDDLVPYLRRLIDGFGAERVLWASDHTHTRVRSSWAELLYSIVVVDALDEQEKVAVLGASARSLFRWAPGDGIRAP
jgi:L-fuconolactonase